MLQYSKQALQVSKKLAAETVNRHVHFTYCVVTAVGRTRRVVTFQNQTKIFSQLSSILQVANNNSATQLQHMSRFSHNDVLYILRCFAYLLTSTVQLDCLL